MEKLNFQRNMNFLNFQKFTDENFYYFFLYYINLNFPILNVFWFSSFNFHSNVRVIINCLLWAILNIVIIFEMKIFIVAATLQCGIYFNICSWYLYQSSYLISWLLSLFFGNNLSLWIIHSLACINGYLNILFLNCEN